MQQHIEVEAKYTINPSDTRHVLQKLQSLQNLGPYHLSDRHESVHSDSYYDSFDLLLAQKKCVLRVRVEEGNNVLLTAKLPSDLDSSAGFSRVELEGSLTADFITQIGEMLKEHALISDLPPLSEHELMKYGYEQVFQNWGFRNVFTGANSRTKFKLLDSNNISVAELSFDQVSFSNAYKSSNLYELEVEVIESSATGLLSDLSREVENLFGSSISRSKKSKYEQGLEFIGTDDSFSDETKLTCDGSLDEILTYFRTEHRIAGFELGSEVHYQIHDTYFDTNDQTLLKNNSYLRLRTRGEIQIFTFRQYHVDTQNQIIDTFEIKKPATLDVLNEIVAYLTANGFLVQQPLQLGPNNIRLSERLATLGLFSVLDAHIDRTLISVQHSTQHFANIKLDNVHFYRGDNADGAEYREIELSTKTEVNLTRVQAIAFMLLAQFPNILKLSYDPKYVVGMNLMGLAQNLTRRVQIPNSVPAFFSRTSSQENVSTWAKAILKRAPEITNDILPKTDENGLNGLKISLEKAIDRSKSAYQAQLSMSVALFVIGLATIIGGILIALQTAQSPLGIVTAVAGAAIEAMIYFPFRKLRETSDRMVMLTTLSDVMQISLEQMKDNPALKEKYIQDLWSTLKGE